MCDVSVNINSKHTPNNPNTVWYGGLHFLRFPIVTIYQQGGVFVMWIYVIRFTFYVTYVRNRLINRIFNIQIYPFVQSVALKLHEEIESTKQRIDCKQLLPGRNKLQNPIIHWCELQMWVHWNNTFTNIQRYLSSITIDYRRSKQ